MSTSNTSERYRRYKGYTIEVVGLSHWIYRDLVSLDSASVLLNMPTTRPNSIGYAQSMSEAKRVVNHDRTEQTQC